MPTPNYTYEPMIMQSVDYVACAASTGQTLGSGNTSGGTKGDYLSHVVIIPGTTSPGAVTLTDGTGSAITIFTGGANSVSVLAPFRFDVGAYSRSGGWKVTTGANVTCMAFGKFT